jgi:hypothetical protein
MRQLMVLTVFTLATLCSGIAQQQPGMGPQGAPGQAAPGQASQPSAQTPDASQSQPSAPGAAAQAPQQAAPQTAPQNGAQTQGPTKPITEGCLGGTSPNFNITDKAGTKYNLNLPPNANASVLTPHVGESVLVMGDVTPAAAGNASSINVIKIGRGQGGCSGSTAKPPTP